MAKPPSKSSDGACLAGLFGTTSAVEISRLPWKSDTSSGAPISITSHATSTSISGVPVRNASAMPCGLLVAASIPAANSTWWMLAPVMREYGASGDLGPAPVSPVAAGVGGASVARAAVGVGWGSGVGSPSDGTVVGSVDGCGSLLGSALGSGCPLLSTGPASLAHQSYSVAYLPLVDVATVMIPKRSSVHSKKTVPSLPAA